MAHPGFERLLVPLIDLVMLGRRWVRLRLSLARAELGRRAGLILTALILAVFAIVLMVMMLVLLVQAGLIGLAALGLSPLQALFAGAGALLVLALILLLVARSCLRRATLPLTPLRGPDPRSPDGRP